MAKQTFTTGQVLTAAQMTSLQQTAMLGGAASAKTASYTLVAADAGTAISMSNAGATTITVNTGLFAAGDTVHITNLGAGVSTITAGTATVNSSASLALAQYESGFLDFTSTSDAIFVKGAGAAAAGGAGNMVQIATGSLTSGSTLSVTGLSSYTDILFVVRNFTFTSTNQYGKFTINNNTGGNYQQFISTISVGQGVTASARDINATNWDLTNYTNILCTNNENHFILKLTNCKNAGFTDIDAISSWRDNNQAWTESSKGIFTDSATVSSLEFFTTGSTTFTAGTYTVWGA
jgi:hypothetical protein